MLYLLTALPGSGKSQLLIERFILDAIRENEAEIAKFKPTADNPTPPVRRQVFANIKGLNIGAIHALVGGFPVQPSPDDWRTCPDGSIVIYDEAQSRHLFPATGRPGLPDDQRISDLDTHRHRGFDIVLSTQDPALVHHWARKFVGRHLHIVRPSGAEMMTIYEWNKAQSSPEEHFTKQEGDTHTRPMNPEIWKLYDSATVHTHKFRMPKGAKWAIRCFLALALIIPLGFCALARSSAPEEVPQEVATVESEGDTFASKLIPSLPAESAPALSSANAWRQSALVEPINGCAAGRHCRCWDFGGKLIDLDDATCRNLAEGIIPMPIDLNLFRRESNGQGGDGRTGAAAPAPGSTGSVVRGVTTSPLALGSPRAGEMQGNAPVTLRTSNVGD